MQLVAEIAIAGRRNRRNDGYPTGQTRHRQLFIQRQYPLFFQSLQYFATTLCQVAQRVGRVDVLHIKCIAIQFVKANSNLHQHLKPRSKRLSRGLFKVGPQQAKDIRPDGATRFRHQTIAVRILLDKLQVAVPGTIGTYIAQLCLNPVGFGQSLFQRKA